MPTPPDRGVSTIPRYGSHHSILGMPARAVAISNSERGDAACDLRWFYRYGLGLGSVQTAVPLSFGSAGHDGMQDIWGWWAATDAFYPVSYAARCASAENH